MAAAEIKVAASKIRVETSKIRMAVSKIMVAVRASLHVSAIPKTALTRIQVAAAEMMARKTMADETQTAAEATAVADGNIFTTKLLQGRSSGLPCLLCKSLISLHSLYNIIHLSDVTTVVCALSIYIHIPSARGTTITKEQYEHEFRTNPDEMMTALHAVKAVLGEFADASITAMDKTKWDAILFHAVKTHGVMMLMTKKAT